MVLDADAKQLDLAMNKRARIYKERVQKAETEKSSKDLNKSLEPNHVYRNSNIRSQVELLPEDLKVMPSRHKHIPLHIQAQRQKQYSTIKKLLSKTEMLRNESEESEVSPSNNNRQFDSLESTNINKGIYNTSDMKLE